MWIMQTKALNRHDREVLSDWLKANLKPELRHRVLGPRIRIEMDSKDDAFKVGQWMRNNNPLGLIDYSVIGVENKQITYLSWCKPCRAQQGNHISH